jgi:hypothetical protein
MDTKPRLVDGIAEVSESSILETPEEIQEKKISRQKEWYRNLNLNHEKIWKELPLVSGAFKKREKGGPRETVSLRIGEVFYDKLARYRDSFPDLFHTSSDVLRCLLIIGDDIFESVVLVHKSEWKDNQDYALARELGTILREQYRIKGILYVVDELLIDLTLDMISEDEICEKIRKLLKPLNLTTRQRVGKRIIETLEKHKLKKMIMLLRNICSYDNDKLQAKM